MKNILILIISITLITGCTNNDDNETDCSLFDPIFPNLYIKIVDFTGNNLLENEMINLDNIIVEGDFSNVGFIFVSENEETNELGNSLLLSIPNESISRYTIHISDTETINLDFKTEQIKIDCDITYNIPTEVEFRTEKLEITEIETLQYVIEIEL